ncbi:hypothetical protein P3T35_002395 [Kitasatospora sp. GP30]|uniref:hypothetical protein n=1 Tax=Kitasatospora sp. GP30 TaxID=3035084 RepID=UPI0015D5AD37|nr:hypothetical protein [Kitasatospora sp. GP30]MDH6140387.1 hypothetical protein [Kitasatospora sp. GP30]
MTVVPAATNAGDKRGDERRAIRPQRSRPCVQHPYAETQFEYAFAQGQPREPLLEPVQRGGRDLAFQQAAGVP